MIGKTNSGGKALPALSNPAVAGDILSKKQAIDSNGDIINGSMKFPVSVSLSVDDLGFTIGFNTNGGSTRSSMITLPLLNASSRFYLAPYTGAGGCKVEAALLTVNY